MKSILFFLFLFANVSVINAQSDPPPPPPPPVANNDSAVIFDRVEVEAAYPGGTDAWRKYLEKNFRADSILDFVWKELPNKVKKKKGTLQITAIVQFVVCKDGSLCDIKTLNNVPAAFRSEAERLIAESKQWIPAEQSGRKVKAYRKQPITMQIEVE